MAPENEIQKIWTEPIFDSEFADLILRLEPTEVKRFNAFQDRFGSQWLNVIPCKNLRLKLSNQQLRIAMGLRLGSKICERHKCVCGKGVTEDGWHGLSCLKSAGRFSRHSNLNAFFIAEFIFYSHSICFKTTTPLQDRSEATRRFDARSMGCW